MSAFEASAAAVLRDAVARVGAETARHIDVANEATRHDVRLVAEAVATLDEKIVREVRRLDESVSRGFAETQAMINFSHAELERRIRSLEQQFSELQARVERLETTAH